MAGCAVFLDSLRGANVLFSLMNSEEMCLCSEETGLPFSHCIHCQVPLLEIDAPWLVNKDYFRGECVLEYAICQPCRDRIATRISEDSKAAVRQFLEHEIDWAARLAEFMQMPDLSERFSKCIACRVPRTQMEGYGISVLFDSGGKLVSGPLPLLICRSCIGRMTALLSEESRGVWRQFVEEHFCGPPDASGFPGLL
jgi:hypothetical protein